MLRLSYIRGIIELVADKVPLFIDPRILAEAIKLAYRRKLSIWYRPEVERTTVGRRATAEEMYGPGFFGPCCLLYNNVSEADGSSSFLSRIFHRYLGNKVARIQAPIVVHYSSIDAKRWQWTFNTRSRNLSTSEATLNRASISTEYLHVLTPAFYSRIVTYQDLDVALTAEVLSADAEENRTAEVLDSGELCALLIQVASSDHDTLHHHHESEPILERMAWILVFVLRRQAAAGSYPSHGSPRQRCNTDHGLKTLSPSIRSENTMQASFLDAFVRHACDRDGRRECQRTVIRLFLARRVALGSVALLRLYWLLLRVSFVAVVIWLIADTFRRV